MIFPWVVDGFVLCLLMSWVFATGRHRRVCGCHSFLLLSSAGAPNHAACTRASPDAHAGVQRVADESKNVAARDRRFPPHEVLGAEVVVLLLFGFFALVSLTVLGGCDQWRR